MGYNRYRIGVVLRAAALGTTLIALAWAIAETTWLVATGVLFIVAAIETWLLIRFAESSNREIARFLDALSFDDTSQSFADVSRDASSHELGEAMSRIIDRLRETRTGREELTGYLQTLMTHVPVALISIDSQNGVSLLNPAALRLFEAPVKSVAAFSRYGEAFATGLAQLRPGETALLRLDRPSGTLHLKVAATEFSARGARQQIVSLQNIANDLSAQELAAWQTVIRTMAHEVMNSLTPLSSLSATANDIVANVLAEMPANDPRTQQLGDAARALEAVTRRSDGLLRFVQNHRRLTHRLTVNAERLAVRRVFVRLHSLLAADFEANGIAFRIEVDPQTLEVTADADLLDQALINLLRNALEAVQQRPDAAIVLSAKRDHSGRAVISVNDNGPGIPPALRDKVFAPFYTTKRQGSGIGLTLVRHIAAVHGASVTLSEAPQGGTTFSLCF